MERNCTQHRDFNEHVYQRLREKYKNFRLPHTWSQVSQQRKRTNLTHLLRSGLETPNTQSSGNTPCRLFSPNWGKQKLIRSLSSKPSSLQSSPALSLPGHAMLSTQFNSHNKNQSSIPLFSNNLDISAGTSLYHNSSVDDMFGTSSQSSSASVTDYSLSGRSSVISGNGEQSITFSKTLKEALNRTLDGQCVPEQNIYSPNVPKSEDSEGCPIKILKTLKSKVLIQSSSVQEPFKDFQTLSLSERSAVQTAILAGEEVAVALSYSDNTSHLGIGSSKPTFEKITVSGICFVFKVDQLNDHMGLFVPVSASGDNDDSIVQFLHSVLSSDILKVSFNAYQLFIVCNIIVKPLLNSGGVKNIIDLKIASWLLTSDDVPQKLCDLKSRYNLNSSNAVVNHNFSFRLHASLIDILEVKQSVYSHLTEEKLLNLFKYLECPLLGTICQMGQTGICIDKKELHLMSNYLKNRLSAIEQEASSVLGRYVQLTSPVQLRQILYEELKLDEKIPEKVNRTAATREKSTSEACLLKLKDLHPLPRIILSHRRISKLKSTYVDGLCQYMKFGKLYPSWDQTSAATGRLASFNPNVQAFPKDAIDDNVDDEHSGRCVREIIVPSSGCQFVAVDFCSIELRILAHFAKDQELIDMFKSSDDIFITLTASWKNIPVESVSTIDRTRTKRVCYAIIYGVGIPKLSQILEISLSEAQILMNSFLAKFQNISKFTNAVIKRARATKKLRTILNRLRHFPDINQSNFALRKSIERQAVNFVIQGSAADICKVSMLKLSEHLRSNTHVNARLLIQIHDELLYEVYHESVIEFSQSIYQILESPEFTSEIHLSVPLRVKVQVGDSWGCMQEFSYQ